MQLMDDAHQKIDVLNEDIQARFKVLNLDKNTDILNFILTENEIQHIGNQRIELEKSLNNNELKCKELSEEIQNMNDKIDADANLSALRDAILSIENQLNEANKQLGILDEKLSNNAKNQAAVADFQAQYQVQQHELNRWDALSNLIGSADGAKFRVFAQGLTLQHLTHLANKHLDKLNSRYLIRKREGDTLQLDIEDTEQANNRRPMNTLSGGESFLASLALALGLSDLAGRKNDIGSLFIDEGFGTLDDDVLETALITLENLRGQGKMIGIISHVSGLKSRIDTQIQVRKLGNGRSEIVVVG
jgi:exonuclease SbcC